MFVLNSFIMGKFTKEQALEELKKQIPGKGEKLNLSERSISEQLETLMPLLATDDTELSDFINKVLPIFKTADANVRNDVSVGIKDYKDKNPVKTQEPPSTKTDTDVKDDAMAAALKRIEELERKNAENEALALRNKRRSDIISKMSDKGCKDKEWVSNLLDEVNLDGEDFDVSHNTNVINIDNLAFSTDYMFTNLDLVAGFLNVVILKSKVKAVEIEKTAYYLLIMDVIMTIQVNQSSEEILQILLYLNMQILVI